MKVEREKIIHFKYQSKAKDVGSYEQSFVIKRRCPKLDLQFISTKAALTGGLTPITRSEMSIVDTIATLTVYFEQVDKHGKRSESAEWIDDIVDPDILFALHKEWLDYQLSFYPEVKQDGESTQTPQTTV